MEQRASVAKGAALLFDSIKSSAFCARCRESVKRNNMQLRRMA